MKYTQYFLHTRLRPDRSFIRDEWIQAMVDQPQLEQIQTDGRIRRWGKIAEYESRVLRVVLLED